MKNESKFIQVGKSSVSRESVKGVKTRAGLKKVHPNLHPANLEQLAEILKLPKTKEKGSSK